MNLTTTIAALPLAFRKLNPRLMIHSPVMFTVLIGSAVCTAVSVQQLLEGSSAAVFSIIVTVWLWLTVLFGNLAEAIAEGRGKAQADSLRAARTSVMARRLVGAHIPAGVPVSAGAPVPAGQAVLAGEPHSAGAEELVAGTELAVGDLVVCEAGDLIPGDGDVVEGLASVDESAITGESAPVIRESGGDRSSVTGGTMVLSDKITVRITAATGKTFLDRMIALVEGATRQKTPNEIALNVLLASLTVVFVAAVMTLAPMARFAHALPTPVVLVALLVCLIPTTIGALVPAIGIAGMDRLIQRNVLATSGRAVETAGDITTLLLDKTGTITYGNRRAVAFIAADGVDAHRVAETARLSSLADETPEGRSIVDLANTVAAAAKTAPTRRAAGRTGSGTADAWQELTPDVEVIEFSAATRMSGLNLLPGHPSNPRHPANPGHQTSPGYPENGAAGVLTARKLEVRKGAAAAVERYAVERGGFVPQEVADAVLEISGTGGTPLLVATYDGVRARILGVIHLADVVKPGMKERFAELRAMGIKTIMITGDNKITAGAIAAEAGVDDFLAEATPEDKLAVIKREQSAGRLVAMTGDGTNDAPALAASDVGVAMNSGTGAAKEAANMVDLDSDPTKLIDIVGIGKALLITRGSLTTFSVANDVAKYFAIVPALFTATFPGLGLLNVMGLHSPESAILSAVIFNALVIVALVPLALRGVKYRAVSAARALSRNLLVYGLGGMIAPFIGIKLIDLLVALIPTIG